MQDWVQHLALLRISLPRNGHPVQSACSGLRWKSPAISAASAASATSSESSRTAGCSASAAPTLFMGSSHFASSRPSNSTAQDTKAEVVESLEWRDWMHLDRESRPVDRLRKTECRRAVSEGTAHTQRNASTIDAASSCDHNGDPSVNRPRL